MALGKIRDEVFQVYKEINHSSGGSALAAKLGIAPSAPQGWLPLSPCAEDPPSLCLQGPFYVRVPVLGGSRLLPLPDF